MNLFFFSAWRVRHSLPVFLILSLSAAPSGLLFAKKKTSNFFTDVNAAWYVDKANIGRTAAEKPLVRVPLELAWKIRVGRSIGATPSAADEFIFISTRDRRIIILERNSGVRVHRRTLKGGFGGPVVIDGVQMYFNTLAPDSRLYYTEINSKEKHFEKKVGSTMASPIVNQDRVFVFTQLGKVLSMNSEQGTKNWEAQLKGKIEFAPLYIDPYLFVPTVEGRVYKLDSSTGGQLASFSVHGHMYCDLSSDGYFLFTALTNGEVYCLEPDSLKVEWKVKIGHPLFSGPVYYKGNVYLSTREGRIVKLAALDGSQIWESGLDGIAVAPPAVTDNYVFTATKSGELAAFDSESGEKLWSKTVDEGISASPLVFKDFVYYCSDRGTVYAFHAK
ncbi:MAG: PQQ-binding-like beta-propeller repeat protein [Candidatus Glassbacteria bacterium]